MMESNFWKQAADILKQEKKHRRWVAVVLCLAMVVAIGTNWALAMRGIAMSHQKRVLECELEIHEHSKRCYDKNGELICGYADYVVHTHNDDCYDEDGNLVCRLPVIKEHEHTNKCYKEEKELVCSLKESKGHEHSSSCYTTVKGDLTCGKEETAGHEHADDCYDEEGNLICGKEEGEGAHKHSDDCYAWEKKLKCGKSEGEGAHKHGKGCYETVKYLTCGEWELHKHTNKCFDKHGNLVCGKIELLEHIHGKDCFKEVEMTEEEVADQTEVQEEPAAEEQEEPATEEIQDTQEPAAEEPTQGEPAAEQPSAEETEQEEQTASLTEEPNQEEKPDGEEIETEEPAAAEPEQEEQAVSFTEADTPEEPSEDQPAAMPEQTFTGNAGGVTVNVTAPEGAFPEGTTMTVTAVSEDQVKDSVAGAVSGEVKRLKAVDITFYDGEGQEIQPAVMINVKLSVDEPEQEEQPVVVHVDHENQANVVDSAVVDDATKEISFGADSFSVYAVAFTVDFHYDVDGKVYDFSIPGGQEIHLSDLADALGLTVGTCFENGKIFVTQIQEVVFSDPALVSVHPEEGDWVLESLQPFHTEESLTITMMNGDVVLVRVTDAQIATHVITADGVGYKITVTYAGDANIPDNAILVASEIREDDSAYAEHLDAAQAAVVREYGETAGISSARFFDVEIQVDGEKIEPEAPVQVTIQQDTPADVLEDENLRIVHFAESGTEVIEDVTVNDSATEITYMQDGFSVIGEVAVSNTYGWPTSNGQYVLAFKDKANDKYYALKQDGSLREVKVSGNTVVFLGEGTDQLSFLDDYLWYYRRNATIGSTGFLSKEYYDGKNNPGNITFIDLMYDSGFSNSARTTSISGTGEEYYIYYRYYGVSYTFSVNNGHLSRVRLDSAAASPIVFANADSFEANESTSNLLTQIDVNTLINKFKRTMTQNLLTDKTAKVHDYANRIYQIDIAASSGYYVAVPDIHMEFVVDASRSMYFPSSLDVVGQLGGTNRTDISNWLSAHGNTNETYFVIRNPNNSATVEAIFYRNGAWRHVDGSNYSPPDTEVYEGSSLDNWNVNNFDGKIYSTTFTGTKQTSFGTRKTWVSRIEYLQQAVKVAAEVVWAINPDASLGLVTFNTNTYDKGTFRVNQSENFYRALRDITLAGGTNQRDGLQKAIDKFNADQTRMQKQLVAVLITDGAPNWGSTSGEAAWNEIRPKATALKNIDDGEGKAELYCMGLSLENVGNNKGSLFGISSGSNYNYNAEDAASIVDCVAQIVNNNVKQAALKGKIVDQIDPVFYPVTADGTPLSNGDWINLQGERVNAGDEDAVGKLAYNGNNDTWSVTWENQTFDWPGLDEDGNVIGPGWQGTVFVKAKENFLGGNNINTNGPGSQVTTDKFIYYGTAVPIEKPVEQKTAPLEMPYVNVDELAFTAHDTEWTVYLGTEVDPWTEIQELLKTIDVREVVSGTVNSQHKVIPGKGAMLSGTSEESETFPLSDVISELTDAQLTALKNGNEVEIPYNNSISSTYGHGNVGMITLHLTKNEFGNCEIHDTDGVGNPREEYKLKVTYTPASETARDAELSIPAGRDRYHNGYGQKGDPTGTIESSNNHLINVFAKGLQITKFGLDNQILNGAKFALYRTARTGETGNLLTIDGKSYVKAAEIDTSATGTAALEAVTRLKDGEQYYLVETKVPDGYLGIDPVPVTLTISDSYTPIPGTASQAAKPESGMYNWMETAALTLETRDGSVIRTNAEHTEDQTNTGIIPNSVTETMYYKVINNPGVSLPNTGGMGTQLFFTAGSALIVMAGVVLFIRRNRTIR